MWHLVSRQHLLNLDLVVAYKALHGDENLLLSFVHRHSSADEHQLVQDPGLNVDPAPTSTADQNRALVCAAVGMLVGIGIGLRIRRK